MHLRCAVQASHKRLRKDVFDDSFSDSLVVTMIGQGHHLHTSTCLPRQQTREWTLCLLTTTGAATTNRQAKVPCSKPCIPHAVCTGDDPPPWQHSVSQFSPLCFRRKKKKEKKEKDLCQSSYHTVPHFATVVCYAAAASLADHRVNISSQQ